MTAEDRAALVVQLRLHEGQRVKPYMDTVGKITIGVGRNLSDKGLTADEVALLLDHDLDEALADCATFPWFEALDAVRQRVLVDMRFNLGPTRFRAFKRMLRALSEQNYEWAATAMRESAWYRQVKARGARLVRMMRTGEDYTA